MSTASRPSIPDFDLAGPLPTGLTILEASAGTGKTFALTALVARFIAEGHVSVDQVLMVTFTRAAAAEMKDRTRQRLLEVLHHLDGSEVSSAQWIERISEGDDRLRSERLDRVRTAVTSIDAATITTIHGFCQQSLREMGIAGGDIAIGEVGEASNSVLAAVLRDEVLTRLGPDPTALTGDRPTDKLDTVESDLRRVISEAMKNAGSQLAPAPGSSEPLADQWAVVAREVIERLRAARIQSGQLSFDDLISGMQEAARQPSVVQRMCRRYRLVLIDEFQDTDAAQWEVFRNLFVDCAIDERPTVVCVGDPKQAIYRFRGADIRAYLDAVDHPDAVMFRMGTNWRTDRALVDAMNVLLDDLDLGDGRIRYHRVEAADEGLDPGLEGGGAPLQFRWVADDQGGFSVTRVRPEIAEDLADHVVQLLNTASIRRNGRSERVRPRDICVLVRKHRHADFVIAALGSRGIPAVSTKVGVVVATDAMRQLRALAAAIATPAHAAAVRALVLTWFVDLPLEQILDDPTVEALQVRCAEWARSLERGGPAALLGSLRGDPAVLAALARADLERRLTDIEHILELAQTEARGGRMSPAHLQRVLDALSVDNEESEARLRRTDTDADAVQITTMHSSKGLEYPIVLLPFPEPTTNDRPYVYRRPDDTSGVRYVDAGSRFSWKFGDDTQARRQALAKAEMVDDERRLIYVALTRAKHQVVMWWANTNHYDNSPTADVLFRTEDGTRFTTPASNDGLADHFASLADRIGPAASSTMLEFGADHSSRPLLEPPQVAGLRAAQWTRGRVDRADWYRWSFSSMMKSDRPASHDREHGGGDEGDGDDTAESKPSDAQFAGALLAMPAHAEFGTLVHELMERVDFHAPDSAAQLGRLIEADTRVASLDIDAVHLRDGLMALIATPLTGLFDGVRLADIEPVDRLAEMDFHFPILDMNQSLLRHKIARIAANDTASPFRRYFTELRNTWSTESIGGLMTGSIDAVLRVDGRYAVVDYKSNRLHPADRPAHHRDYTGRRLLAAMESHDYPMQALLYSVALHRFLSARLPGYDPNIHHGGTGYLFIRGMTGATTDTYTDTTTGTAAVRGLCAWRPSISVIEQLDTLFAGAIA